ncbi:MAG: hypothetical protein HDR06_15985 [Lachnospiraceae bacterium]|nr:hypothetical protein [Lachnospiraceae bacterium]
MINSALANGVMALTGGATPASLDFSESITSSLNGISADFAKLALIAVPIALGIWAAPRVVRIVMRFFSALTH